MPPLVSLVCCVRGPSFERYAAQLRGDWEQYFLPGESEWVQLPAREGWPDVSSRRYEVILDHWGQVCGQWVFLIDADSRIEAPVGREILADGLTVTTHPGFPSGTPADACPYCRDPDSRAHVPYGQGRQYHPGAFVGGKRDAFQALAEHLRDWTAADLALNIKPVWYDESYLNRYLLDHPPALILDHRYCYWDHWGPSPDRIVVHLDKTEAEFIESGRAGYGSRD